MAAGVGGATKLFWNLVNNWKEKKNAELKLSSEDGHLLVKYSVDLGVWVPPAPKPPASRSPAPKLPSDSANRDHQGPRKGASPSRQRRRERRAAARAAASVIENGTSEKVVAKSSDSVEELIEDITDDVATESAEEVDVAANEKVTNVNSEEVLSVKITEKVAAEEEESEEYVTVKSIDFVCDQCEYANISEKGLAQHKRMKHRISQVDGLIDSDEDLTDETSEKLTTSNDDFYTLEVTCAKHVHSLWCCDIKNPSLNQNCPPVPAPPKVFHPNLEVFGYLSTEVSTPSCSTYLFEKGNQDILSECFKL